MENPQELPITTDDTLNRVENQSNGAEVPVNFKISAKRILKLKSSVKNFKFDSKNEDLSILHIDECENLEDANAVIQNLDFQNAPNIFVIVIDTKNENTKSIEKLQEEIIKKFNEIVFKN